MDLMIPQPASIQPVLPPPPTLAATVCVTIDLAAWHQRDRIARIGALTPQDTTAGLIWLAMNYPAVCDAMLDKVEYDAIDDPHPSREPAPFCAECGADIGIFLRLGQDWHHYNGDGTITGKIRLYDPGHDPVLAWRPARLPTAP